MTTYLVRKTGNDNNGGTSASVRSTGTDGVTNGTNTLTAATGTWSAADIGHGIFIGGVNQWRLITAVASATSLTFSGATIANGSGRTWTIGGAWLTVAKVVGTAGIVSGDICYFGAGSYRETVTVNMTSPVAETKLIGDYDGRMTGDAGYVIFTAYTTNDKTAPASADTFILNGRDFITFENIVWVNNASSFQAIDGNTSHSTNITIRRCVFLAGGVMTTSGNIAYTGLFATAANWLIENCIFAGTNVHINITLPTGVGSDYDSNFQIRNCRFEGANSAAVSVGSSGTSANEGGGVDIRNCTFRGCAVNTTGTRISLTIPCTVNNSYFLAGGVTPLVGGESGALTEDWNLVIASTPRSNVSAGANSIATAYAPLIHVGQATLFGFQERVYGEPMFYDAPMMAFGDDGTALTSDLLGTLKPSGGRSTTRAVGCFEFRNAWYKGTGTVRTGSNGLECTGPADHFFEIPVDATSTTVTLYVQWDGTYAGTKPSMSVMGGGECGVSDATATAVGSSGAWEQLSLNFTPTSKGVVTIRLRSSSTAGGGKAFADDFAVT